MVGCSRWTVATRPPANTCRVRSALNKIQAVWSPVRGLDSFAAGQTGHLDTVQSPEMGGVLVPNLNSRRLIGLVTLICQSDDDA